MLLRVRDEAAASVSWQGVAQPPATSAEAGREAMRGQPNSGHANSGHEGES
jgi:hypothetical protein